MWDLPRPGLEPVSPALAGRFLTTVPPGKSPHPLAFSAVVDMVRFKLETLAGLLFWISEPRGYTNYKIREYHKIKWIF